ncbi:uncharacterized protein PAE49_011874 [Odontesthes bonariensis]|uniref:uncharacterized protein LOC142390346 n=1 Tax=Odontesthes bonariensis TaxID=219752 RepID=UPI003F5806A2
MLTRNPSILSKMTTCYISGCKNRYSPSNSLKFYRIPSGSSPFQANRRRLWIQAIQQANCSSEEFRRNARICGAHFISGEASMDHDRPDFVPSVFTCTKQSRGPRKKTKWIYGRRKRRRRKATAEKEEQKTSPGPDSPADFQSSDLMETESELSVHSPSTTSLPKERTLLTEEVGIEAETNTIQLQTKSIPNTTFPSIKVPAGIPKLDNINPVVLLKPVIVPAGGYMCELCNQTFTHASQLVKHKQLHDEQKSCVSGETDLAEPHLVPSDEPSFPCNMCDRSFVTSQNLKRHKLLHVRDGRKCFKCGVLFCRRHNHISFQTKIRSKPESDEDEAEDLPTDEGQNLNSLSPEKSLPECHVPEMADNAQSSHAIELVPFTLIFLPKQPPPCSHHIIPALESVKASPLPRPPSPIFQFSSHRRKSLKLNSPMPDYPPTFVQPHLPQHPELPSSLKIFSPQCLTSAFLEVQRNYEYILSKSRKVKIEKIVKEEPDEPVMICPEVQTVKQVKKEKIAYDLEIVL